MPQTCPHCGIALTGTIDAFCPECREDLSATPEEVQDTAERTFATLFATTMGGGDAPDAEKTKGAVVAAVLTSVVSVGLVVALIERDWDKAILAALGLVVCVAWSFGVYRDLVVKTSVTGRDKTSKDAEQPE